MERQTHTFQPRPRRTVTLTRMRQSFTSTSPHHGQTSSRRPQPRAQRGPPTHRQFQSRHRFLITHRVQLVRRRVVPLGHQAQHQRTINVRMFLQDGRPRQPTHSTSNGRIQIIQPHITRNSINLTFDRTSRLHKHVRLRTRVQIFTIRSNGHQSRRVSHRQINNTSPSSTNRPVVRTLGLTLRFRHQRLRFLRNIRHHLTRRHRHVPFKNTRGRHHTRKLFRHHSAPTGNHLVSTGRPHNTTRNQFTTSHRGRADVIPIRLTLLANYGQ